MGDFAICFDSVSLSEVVFFVKMFIILYTLFIGRAGDTLTRV